MWMSRNRARVWFRFFFIYNFLPRNIHTAARLKPYSRKVTILYFLLFKFQSIQSLHSQTANVLNSRNHLDFFLSLFFTSNSLSVHRLLRSSRSMHSQHCCCIFSFILVYFCSNDSHMLLSTANKLNWNSMSLVVSDSFFMVVRFGRSCAYTTHFRVCIFIEWWNFALILHKSGNEIDINKTFDKRKRGEKRNEMKRRLMITSIWIESMFGLGWSN